jgi:hypothetical protein
MRTTILLDDDLVNEALALTGARSKREVVQIALQELIRSRKKKNLADLAGQIRLRDGYDYKALRKTRGHSKQKRTSITTFGGTGLHPGVNLEDSAALHELMEASRDSVRRQRTGLRPPRRRR